MTQAQFDALIGLQKQIAAIGHSLSDWVRELGPSVCITIRSVYGKPFEELRPPAGHKFKMEHQRNFDGQIMNITEPAFRPALRGEWYMGVNGEKCAYGSTEPRLILVKCKRLVYDILEEDRPPRTGQLYSIGSGVMRALDGGHAQMEYILSEPRVEE